MRITVTQKHIDKGVPRGFTSCALALAFKSAGFPKVMVGAFGVCPRGSRSTWINLPIHVHSFRERFDAELPVKPLTFEMDIPTC